jgi:histidine triad (HIT) family protein
MMACIFCRISAGELPSMKIFEDEATVAIMDINPINIGHALVIAKHHAETLYDLPEAAGAAVMRTVQRVAGAIRDTVKPAGLNLLQANGPAAFQSVTHFHIHLIPRFTDDGKGLQPSPTPTAANRIQELAERIRSHIVS